MKALLLRHLKSYESWSAAALLGFGLLLHGGLNPLVAVTWLAWGIGAIKLVHSHNHGGCDH